MPYRIVMAPSTRSRSRPSGNVPTALNACYHAQRASAALIISETTRVSMQGQGYAWTPGIHSRGQVEGGRLTGIEPWGAVARADGVYRRHDGTSERRYEIDKHHRGTCNGNGYNDEDR